MFNKRPARELAANRKRLQYEPNFLSLSLQQTNSQFGIFSRF